VMLGEHFERDFGAVQGAAWPRMVKRAGG
jgi:hypothetical protein